MLDMTYVEQVKTPIRKDNTFAALAMVLHSQGEVASIQNFSWLRYSIGAQRGLQFFQTNDSGAYFAHDNTGCNVGYLHGFRNRSSSRYCHAEARNSGVSSPCNVEDGPCLSWNMHRNTRLAKQ